MTFLKMKSDGMEGYGGARHNPLLNSSGIHTSLDGSAI
jgi:hypothetical protein